MVQQQKTPTLRFKEFNDEWNNFKIGDIFNVTRGQVLAVNQIKEIKDNDNCYPVYSSQTKNDGLLGYYDKYLFDTAITWTTDGANAGTVSFRKGKFFSTNVNGVLLSEDGFSNKMVAEALNNVAWRHVSRVGNPKLMNNVMSEIVLPLPSLPEQSAIGSLFQTLDELLSAYKDNLVNYEVFKTSMLSKLFPKAGQTTPEIRLDGFDDEWEEKKFYNLVKRVSESSDSIDLPKVEFEDIVSGEGRLNKDVSQKFDSRKGTRFKSGFILYGKLRPYLNNWLLPKFEGVALGDFWVFNPQNNNSEFIFYLIQSSQYQKVANDTSGTKMPRSDWKTVSNTLFAFPMLEEQRAIGAFFSNLDNLISSYQEKIMHLETLNKRLLQEMFI